MEPVDLNLLPNARLVFWYGGDSGVTRDEIASEFEGRWYDDDTPDLDISYADILIATYGDGSGGYDGYAFILFQDTLDEKFYEVNGSHCSCHGLEEQWIPEEVVFAELLNRPNYTYADDPNSNLNQRIREAVKDIARDAGII